MKRIKIGATIIFLAAAIYFILSYGIFFLKKESLDVQLKSSEENSADRESVEPQDNVVIQRNAHENDDKNKVFVESAPDDFIVTQEIERPLPILMVEEPSLFVIKAADRVVDQDLSKIDSYSFVTMPIPDDYKMDQETQKTLDALIGSDLDEFVRVVLQSNNNIVSKEACRSCGMYAFFSAIKKHQPLSADEVVVLQKLLANLYQFVQKTKALTKFSIILLEQYNALQDLNRSQAEKNDMKLKARRTATAAALKKLQSIQYNR